MPLSLNFKEVSCVNRNNTIVRIEKNKEFYDLSTEN